MKLAIGSDHAGYQLKSQLAAWLKTSAGGRHQVRDVGTSSEASCDYPDFARPVARAVAKKRVSRGILLCGTGIGMAIAANKFRGVRAAVVWSPAVAGLAAEHNGANVICLPARFLSLATAKKIIHVFLSTPFGGGRHLRRLKKIMALDRCAQ
jgi:ribose 5-phosphate isomerase B